MFGLLPQQFGVAYGPAAADIQKVAAWLQTEGFSINRISNSGTIIEFSGNAGQVQGAFRTSIHRYKVDGIEHWANVNDPSIPQALAPVVVGIETLHNFPRKPMHVVAGVYTRDHSTGFVKRTSPGGPLYNITCGSDQNNNPITCFELGPFDFSAIYNVAPLWNSTPPIDGTGQTIAVIGESDVNMTDMVAFRLYSDCPPRTRW